MAPSPQWLQWYSMSMCLQILFRGKFRVFPTYVLEAAFRSAGTLSSRDRKTWEKFSNLTSFQYVAVHCSNLAKHIDNCHHQRWNAKCKRQDLTFTPAQPTKQQYIGSIVDFSASQSSLHSAITTLNFCKVHRARPITPIRPRSSIK